MLCFVLTNAPASFSRLLSSLLQELNGDCIVLFLDDILVYSASLEDHKHHLRRLFEILRAHKLYAKRSKCSIGVREVEFLGHLVSSKGVRTVQRLTDAVQEWPVPTNIKDVQSFLGLCNYYRRFVLHYAAIAQPLSDLVRTKYFEWNKPQQEAFERLKEALSSAPILRHATATDTFVATTDASKYAVGATLEQSEHPVSYLSHRLSKAESNWDTGDQELLGFIIALRE